MLCIFYCQCPRKRIDNQHVKKFEENFEDQCKIFVQLCLFLRLFSVKVPWSSSSIIIVLLVVAGRRRGECERSSPTAKLRGSVNTDKSVPTGDNQQVPPKGEPSDGSSAPLSLPSEPLQFHKLAKKGTNCFNVKRSKVFDVSSFGTLQCGLTSPSFPQS